MSHKIVPHLWFATEAKEAAEFYTSIFPILGDHARSAIHTVTTLRDTPSGDCDVVSFELWGCPFRAISAGPLFRFNPSTSFMVNFDPSQDSEASVRIEDAWNRLIEGGKILMPLDAYPFSKRYGWVEDKYGLSWQLILTDPDGEVRPLILPSLLFVGAVYGKAEEASQFYLSVFQDSTRGALARYPAGAEPDKEGAIMFTDFRLLDRWFTAMDSAQAHGFAFNEAISFIVRCEDQQEIDFYWNKLSAVPEAEQCGWLKDPYGVSWQIVPSAIDEMMSKGNPEQVARVTEAFLKMKKFDIATLNEAYKGVS